MIKLSHIIALIIQEVLDGRIDMKEGYVLIQHLLKLEQLNEEEL